MKAVPMELKSANEFVEKLHRHHMPVCRDKFRLGCEADDGHLCGVIQVGRPLSRHLDDGKTLEVRRCCTDGTYNACSFLYARAARIAKELGYEKMITYILQSETGTSLKASGWTCEEENARGGSWDTPGRPRELSVSQSTALLMKEKKYPTEKKQRWVIRFAEKKQKSTLLTDTNNN